MLSLSKHAVHYCNPFFPSSSPGAGFFERGLKCRSGHESDRATAIFRPGSARWQHAATSTILRIRERIIAYSCLNILQSAGLQQEAGAATIAARHMKSGADRSRHPLVSFGNTGPNAPTAAVRSCISAGFFSTMLRTSKRQALFHRVEANHIANIPIAGGIRPPLRSRCPLAAHKPDLDV
jgi:hypothetical protein